MPSYPDPFANKKKVKKGPDGAMMEADTPQGPTPTPTGFRGFSPNGPLAPIAMASQRPTPIPNAVPGQQANPTPIPNAVPGATAQPQMLANRPGAAYGTQNALTGGSTTTIPAATQKPMGVEAPPPIPFNDRRAGDRAAALKLRTLHSGPGGLDPMKEARIAQIYAAQDQTDAYARANRPLQKVQTPGEIADRHSELGRNLVSGFRTELEGIDQQINALKDEPLSDDRIRRGEILAAQRANKAAQLQKAMTDPYWQQTTPERAGQIQAGQQRLNDRQQADRTSGAADVAAYQDRQQYDRNLADTVRQREVAETLAESKARETSYGADAARSQAVINNGGQNASDRVANAQADLDVAKANAYTRILGSPDAARNFERQARGEMGLTQPSPESVKTYGDMLTTALSNISNDTTGFFGMGRGVDPDNQKEIEASLDIFETAISRLEDAAPDYADDVSRYATMTLAALPGWLRKPGAVNIALSDPTARESLSQRIKAIAPRLSQLSSSR